jgi:acetyl-CoA carboxylase biotin carboxyl carrier protein
MTDDARVGGLPGDEAVNPDTAGDGADAADVPDALVPQRDAADYADDAVDAGDPPAAADAPSPPDAADAKLLALIDRLAALLDRSDLTELEVEAGGTGLILRKPVAVAVPAGGAAPAVDPAPLVADRAHADAVPAERPAIKAPLTGIFYASPAPGSAPYVQVGGEVAVGQVIGLIEAMKLFNEIKSDLAGRVVKVVAESGALVKAKQPLIEVEPL